MQRNFRVIAKLETSHHDGWCSGDECEYECAEETTHELQIPADAVPATLAAFAPLLPDPLDVDTTQSHYCHLNEKCAQAGLGKHDFRYTVTSATEVLSTEGMLCEAPVGDGDGTMVRVRKENASASLLRVYFVNAARTAEVAIPPNVRAVDGAYNFPMQKSRDGKFFLLGSSDEYVVYFGGRVLLRFAGERTWRFTRGGGEVAAAIDAP